MEWAGPLHLSKGREARDDREKPELKSHSMLKASLPPSFKLHPSASTLLSPHISSYPRRRFTCLSFPQSFLFRPCSLQLHNRICIHTLLLSLSPSSVPYIYRTSPPPNHSVSVSRRHRRFPPLSVALLRVSRIPHVYFTNPVLIPSSDASLYQFAV